MIICFSSSIFCTVIFKCRTNLLISGKNVSDVKQAKSYSSISFVGLVFDERWETSWGTVPFEFDSKIENINK